MRRRKFVAADWVYRDNVYDDAGATIENLGSYVNTPTALTPGVANALVKSLYDSHNYMKGVVAPSAGTPFVFGSAARAEAHRPLILGVEGQVIIRPSTWALGDNIVLGARVAIFEQDAGNGVALLDPTYTMFNTTPNVSINPANWANDRTWIWERRMYETFLENRAVFRLFLRLRFRRRLLPHQALFLYLETNNQGGTTGSVNVQVTPWVRSLVADEG